MQECRTLPFKDYLILQVLGSRGMSGPVFKRELQGLRLWAWVLKRSGPDQGHGFTVYCRALLMHNFGDC